MGIDFQKYSGKNVLVTGASGFIGPHLCSRLSALDANVFAVARNIDGKLEDLEKVTPVKADFSRYEEVEKVFKQVKPEYTFHLAGLAAGGRELDLIESTLHSNLLTSVNVLKAGTEYKCGRLIIIGSMEEPTSEDKETVPSSPYAASKLASSSYARMFHKLYDLDVVIARLFMTYGPGIQPPKKLLPYVVNSLLDDKSPKLGSGKRLIDWIYIDDVIEGLLALGLAEGIQGKTLDIGSGKLISTLDFVNTIIEIVGTDVELIVGHREDRKMEQEKKADREATFNVIGWKPQIHLKDGLTRTVDWYRKQQKPAFH